MTITIVLLVLFLAAAAFLLVPRFKRSKRLARRATVLANSFPESWREILQSDFGLYRRLPADLKAKLEGHTMVFLDEKNIIGCNGQEITDRVRVLVAAQACVLILNKPTDYFPGFQTILVYPDVYEAVVTRHEGALQSESVDVRAGESWVRGPVVLAWSHVLQGAQDSRDGHNVVMHEFAHKLDEQNNAMNGLPVLSDNGQYRNWSKVLAEEYQQRQDQLLKGDKSVIDSYGATSPAEFFAVVTETFFEKPRQLLRHHPELYEQLQKLYQLDPVEWGHVD